MKALKGNKGVYIFMRKSEGKAHFKIISLQDSYESIKEFAGENYELARYYPEDVDYLLELEKYVTHYEVLFPFELTKNFGVAHQAEIQMDILKQQKKLQHKTNFKVKPSN